MRLRKPLTLVALSLLSFSTFAQESVPSGKAVLDKYLEATGGKAAYEKVKSRRVTGSLTIVGLNIGGPFEQYSSEDGTGVLKITLAGMGDILQGYDGTYAWMSVPAQGPRILEGKEKDTTIRMFTNNAELKTDELYSSVENKGVEDLDGKKVYKLELTSKGGSTETRYYGVEDGLLHKSSTTAETQMGEMKSTTTYSNYVEVDGIKYSMLVNQDAGPQKMAIKTEKVEHNPATPPAGLAVPADVKELIDADKAMGTPSNPPAATAPGK